MITLGLAFAGLAGTFVSMYLFTGAGIGWSVFASLVAFLAVQGGLSAFFLKRIKADMLAVQKVVAEGQKAVEAKTRAWQFRPPGSVQEAQRIIAEDMRAAVRKALDETARLEKYRPWVLFVSRQIATARLHLNWMIKDFKAVDAEMPRALLLDAVSLSMKMARLQMLDAPLGEIEKVYDKAVARARYNDNVLPAACWSWILVQRGETDRAFKALTQALKKSDNETLKKNHEALMNNRVLHFNNSGLGDQWYALHLEEPKIRQQRPRSAYR